MELDDALDRISEIHARLVRDEVFRGYRSVPMALTGLCAILGAGLQAFGLPAASASDYVVHWLGVAAVCGIICGTDLWMQGRTQPIRTLRQRTLPVLAQFLPALAVGAALTLALLDTPHAVLLPGLWAVVFALGVFSSRPFLPRAVGWVSAYYLLVGTGLLLDAAWYDPGPATVPSPWAMGLTFGLGQAFLAVVLHCDLERGRVAPLEVDR